MKKRNPMLLLIGDNTRVPMNDAQLDRFAEALKRASADGGGVWITGNLTRWTNDQLVDSDPANGHQRLWVHPSQLITLVYDRPEDSPTTPLPPNVVPFGPRG